MRFLISLGALVGVVLASAAPVTASAEPASPHPADPWEGFNRGAFAFTSGLDKVALRPLAIGYQRITPRPLRTGLRNAFSNLGEPVVALNDLLQGRLSAAGGSVVRFTTNSTFGVLGLFDLAGALKLPHHDNSFGLTLGRYGAPAGPYVFLPVLGPTTVRDGFGRVIDIASDPLTYAQFRGDDALRVSRAALGALDDRAEADDRLQSLEASATDDYATIRSVYLQSREADVRGDTLQDDKLPEFEDAPAEPPPVAAPPN